MYTLCLTAPWVNPEVAALCPGNSVCSCFSFHEIIVQATYTEAGAVDEFGSHYSPVRREYYTEKMENDEILSYLSKVTMTLVHFTISLSKLAEN